MNDGDEVYDETLSAGEDTDPESDDTGEDTEPDTGDDHRQRSAVDDRVGLRAEKVPQPHTRTDERKRLRRCGIH